MRRTLITGANRGIGLEFARQCLADGDLVFACCRNPSSAPELSRLSDEHSQRLVTVELDVTDECSLGACREVVEQRVKALDLVINNAGYTSNIRERLDNLRPAIMLRHLRVNAIGPLMVSKEFRRLLREGTSPTIVAVSSEAGSFELHKNAETFRGYSYAASKSALNMYLLTLSVELRDAGITVLALHPGFVRTRAANAHAPMSAEESVTAMLETIARTKIDDTGSFLRFDGEPLPW